MEEAAVEQLSRDWLWNSVEDPTTISCSAAHTGMKQGTPSQCYGSIEGAFDWDDPNWYLLYSDEVLCALPLPRPSVRQQREQQRLLEQNQQQQLLGVVPEFLSSVCIVPNIAIHLSDITLILEANRGAVDAQAAAILWHQLRITLHTMYVCSLKHIFIVLAKHTP
jgi:hypothetical protein